MAVVQVVEFTARALVKDSLTSQCDTAVVANAPAGGVDGTSLGRAIELELVV